MILHFIKKWVDGRSSGPRPLRSSVRCGAVASAGVLSLGLISACVLPSSALADDNARPLALGEERVGEDEGAIADEMVMLIKQISQQRQRAARDTDEQLKSGPASDYYHRFNQVETLGCFQADFKVYEDLPAALRKGLFASAGEYEAALRFANASTFDDAEKDLRGLSIRVNVSDSGDSPRYQTFLMNSHPVLFADTPETFLKFIRATANGRRWWFFVNPFDSHFKALWILFQARDHHASPFDVPYWTTTPARYGGERTAAKFSAQPCSEVQSNFPAEKVDGFLQENMKKHLMQAPVCYRLLAQLQQDAQKQPIEDASSHWAPEDAPFVAVAEIHFTQQGFDTADAMLACEQEVFDPWQALPAHLPLGGMNRVRRLVYDKVAKFRLQSHSATVPPKAP